MAFRDYLQLAGVLCIGVALTACDQPPKETTQVDDDLLSYVDPFIGTGGHGHTFPGATAPFGMVQLSPDNPSKGWDWTSGYHYSDNVILGFSHTHLSGTGVGDLLDVLVTPFHGDYQTRLAEQDNSIFTEYTQNTPLIYDTYSHNNEVAQAGYYAVQFEHANIYAEMTATPRVGVHRYTFSNQEDAKLLFNLGYAQNYDKAVETHFTRISDTKVVGYRTSTGWAKRQTIYFAAEFNKPFTHRYYENKKPTNEQNDSHTAVLSEMELNFGPLSDTPLVVKVGISYASVEGAEANIAAETTDFNFEKIKQATQAQWRGELAKIQVDSVDKDKKTKFYTAYYHALLAPHLHSDALGQYTGADGEVKTNTDRDTYSLFSLWDTFRTLHPLITLTHPERVDDMMHSMMAFYDQTGLLPTWDLMFNETDVMIGYHAVPVLVDAYFKGLTSLDPYRILEASKASAMQDNFGIKYFKEYGYIPSELEVEAVSKTLEYAFDDWAIARLAAHLGEEEDAAYFSERANAYKTLFDKQTGFMRGKNKDGEWISPFNPTYVEHRNTDYTEANAWQYTWFVPHDVEGLIALFGGTEPFIQKLDALFTVSSEMQGDVSPDITGLIGQYAHGNEPVHHVPYMYAIAGYPEKGNARIKQIRDTMYTTQPNGLAGNDDVGQMSAWYVMSALGFYPLNAASGEYVFGTPEFDKVTVLLGDNTLTIRDTGPKEKPITSVQFNDEATAGVVISHAHLVNGGTLTFTRQ